MMHVCIWSEVYLGCRKISVVRVMDNGVGRLMTFWNFKIKQYNIV